MSNWKSLNLPMLSHIPLYIEIYVIPFVVTFIFSIEQSYTEMPKKKSGHTL